MTPMMNQAHQIAPAILVVMQGCKVVAQQAMKLVPAVAVCPISRERLRFLRKRLHRTEIVGGKQGMSKNLAEGIHISEADHSHHRRIRMLERTQENELRGREYRE